MHWWQSDKKKEKMRDIIMNIYGIFQIAIG